MGLASVVAHSPANIMKSFRQISSPRLAMMVAGIGVGGLIVWWTFGDPSAGRTGDSGGIAAADSSGGAVTQAAATPPWASEEQKSKAEEREALRRKKFELYAELTKGLPDLQPKLEGIPEFEVNGYERLVALAKAREEDLPEVPDEFMEMLEGKRPWDGLAVGEYLKQHAELLNELAAISRLPAGEVDWRTREPTYFTERGPTSIRHMAQILGIAALNAAYDGSPVVALDWMEVAGRLSGHLRGPENAPFISHLMGLVLTDVVDRQVPRIAKLAVNSPGLQARIDALLDSHRLTPADMARNWRGETIYSALDLMVPVLANNPKCFEPVTFEEAKRLLRVKFEADARDLKAMREASDFAALNVLVGKLAAEQKGASDFSPDARTLLESMWGDPSNLIGSYARFETRRQLARAAVRLARDDATPETILAEVAASEPEARKLHYDPATRTLTSEPFLTETEKISIQVP